MLSVGEYVLQDEIELREREDENEGLPAKLFENSAQAGRKKSLTYD